VAALAGAAEFAEAERATLALTHEMSTKEAVSEGTMRRVRAVQPDAPPGQYDERLLGPGGRVRVGLQLKSEAANAGGGG